MTVNFPHFGSADFVLFRKQNGASLPPSPIRKQAFIHHITTQHPPDYAIKKHLWDSCNTLTGERIYCASWVTNEHTDPKASSNEYRTQEKTESNQHAGSEWVIDFEKVNKNPIGLWEVTLKPTPPKPGWFPKGWPKNWQVKLIPSDLPFVPKDSDYNAVAELRYHPNTDHLSGDLFVSNTASEIKAI